MNHKYIIIILTLFILIFIGCDEIEKPYLRESNGGNGGDPPETGLRKVLIEEFTGHKCVNCPQAHQIIDELKEEFDEELVAIAVHAGSFAEPDTDPESLYTNDYRTATGQELNSTFQVQGYPTAMINRKENAFLYYRSSWKAEVRQIMGEQATVGIEIQPEYTEGSSTLGADIKVMFTETPENQVNLCVYITESGVISAQLNRNEEVGPTPDIVDYEHNHVLRGSLNGTWGDPVTEGAVVSGMVYSHTLGGFALSDEWVPQNMAVVAFVYDQATQEVLQVEKTKIK
jgi:thiol-disulfide isomerase/thioredoxin